MTFLPVRPVPKASLGIPPRVPLPPLPSRRIGRLAIEDPESVAPLGVAIPAAAAESTSSFSTTESKGSTGRTGNIGAVEARSGPASWTRGSILAITVGVSFLGIRLEFERYLISTDSGPG